MKSEETRMPVKHQIDHVLPPVIHNVEPDDRPVLARWVDHAMENQTRFWGLLLGSIAALVGLVVVYNLMSGGQGATNEAWSKLETAKTSSERVEIAKEFPKTPAALWALLQAAGESYNQGFLELPGNKDVALPTLKKALDLFEKVVADAPADSIQARVAALGIGALMRLGKNLDKAVKQYEKVAATKAWAGTDEAIEAARLAKLLKRPESIAFYQALYDFKPVEATLPPGGSETLKMPFDSSILGVPGSDGLKIPGFDFSTLPPPPSSPTAAPASASTSSDTKLDALPADPFAAPVPALTPEPAPKAETPAPK